VHLQGCAASRPRWGALWDHLEEQAPRLPCSNDSMSSELQLEKNCKCTIDNIGKNCYYISMLVHTRLKNRGEWENYEHGVNARPYYCSTLQYTEKKSCCFKKILTDSTKCNDHGLSSKYLLIQLNIC